MRILAIDTALPAISACVLDEGAEDPVSIETIAMERGHAEALLPLIDRVMARVEGGFASLDRVAVTVGPGSFTGLRVGIAAARAIGVACKIPVIGVSTLAALAAPLDPGAKARSRRRRDRCAARQCLSLRLLDRTGGPAAGASGRCRRARRCARLAQVRCALAGSGAALLAREASAAGTEIEIESDSPALDIVFVAKLGLLADPALAPPRPLYLKAPDAKVPETAQVQPAPS